MCTSLGDMSRFAVKIMKYLECTQTKCLPKRVEWKCSKNHMRFEILKNIFLFDRMYVLYYLLQKLGKMSCSLLVI